MISSIEASPVSNKHIALNTSEQFYKAFPVEDSYTFIVKIEFYKFVF